MSRGPKHIAGEDEAATPDLEELLALTAHELHEPLRKIAAFGDMLKQHAGPALDDESLDYLARIERATERMRSTLGRVITFARVPRGLPFVTIDLNEAVAGAAEKVREALSASGASLEIEPLPSIQGDPFQMQQMFEQLLDNAIKFRKPNVAPIIRIHAVPSEPGTVRIHIEDNGEGFDNAYAARIFRPFERLHGRGAHAGAGLGLAICQKIAERHGGKLSAFGTPGEGAVISFVLPERKAKPQAATAS